MARSTSRRRSVRRCFATVAALTTLVATLAIGVDTSGAAPPDRGLTLTLLHNNDGESQVVNAGTGIEDFGGVARFAEVVKAARSAGQQGRDAGSILVSSGDNFLAGPEFTAGLTNGVPFFDTIAIDSLRYDAISFGNHEFDFGPDVLSDFLTGFTNLPPFLASNVDFSGEPGLQQFVDEGDIAPSAVIEVKGHEIGIIGALTPQLPFISSPRNVVVDPDVAGAVQGEVETLEAAGVNKIILISHLQNVQEDIALASQLDGVDVMVAGGGDEVLANPGDLLVPGDASQGPYPTLATDSDGTAVPVVTTSGNYKYLGRLVIEFDGDGDVVTADGGPIRVAGGDQPDAVKSEAGNLNARVVRPVSEFLAELDETVVGNSEVALDGRRVQVRTAETNEGNLIADSAFDQATLLAPGFGVSSPDVALQNGGGIRNDDIRGPGPITVLDTFDMLPFGNFLSIVEDVPRDQFKEILENAVSQVEGVQGRFAQVSGFSFSWDLNGTPQVLDADRNVVTPGDRIVDVTLDDATPIVSGGVVQLGDPLTVAISAFLATGGDQYPFRGAPFTTLGVTDQQALASYIADTLGGSITAAQYPEGGEGRIVRLP